jgi:hypothetical protein
MKKGRRVFILLSALGQLRDQSVAVCLGGPGPGRAATGPQASPAHRDLVS